MSVQPLDQWAGSRVQSFSLSTLKDAVIGVDASYYLDLRLNKNSQEPLIHALGGTPYCLKKIVKDDVQALRKYDVSLIFVFNGLDFVGRQHPPAQAMANFRAHEDGWQHYQAGDAEQTVSDFTRASFPVEMLHRNLQKLLTDLQVQYIVAPYSATAQLSYLDKQPNHLIDAVMGSTDCFLFDVDKVIFDFDIAASSFNWLSKTSCEERLEKAPADLFRDAQLLLGSPFLPVFPPLERSPTGKATIRDALNLMNGAGRSVVNLCHQYRDDAAVRSLQYEDRYKKAIMTIKYHVVMQAEGVVQPLDFEHAPGDVHDFVGRRLPEELFFYISKGMIGPQIPNWLTSGEIVLSLPGGIVDSELYRRLVVDQLNPLRTVTLKLLADSLSRYYQSRVVRVRTWYDRDTSGLTISVKDATSVSANLASWKVREDILPPELKLPSSEKSLLATLQALQDSAFVSKTLARPVADVPLSSSNEIIKNVLWRFLHVRGFIDDKHELTAWGKTLLTTLAALDPNDKVEELGILAIELMRLGALTSNEINGAPAPVNDKNRAMTNLITRIACLGRLKHEAVGYSGPLERPLLSFAWMITAIRTSLRDLIETVLATMCLNGDVDRERSDWSELALSLPFIEDNGCGLAIATKTYLDLANKEGDPPPASIKNKIRTQEKPYSYFQFVSNLGKNLDMAFRLWDGVYEGSQVAPPREFKEAKLFNEADEWLKTRRSSET